MTLILRNGEGLKTGISSFCLAGVGPTGWLIGGKTD